MAEGEEPERTTTFRVDVKCASGVRVALDEGLCRICREVCMN